MACTRIIYVRIYKDYNNYKNTVCEDAAIINNYCINFD